MSEKACILELGGAMQQSPESEPGLRLLRDSPQGSAEVIWVSAKSLESEHGLRLLLDSPQGSAEVSSFVGSMRRVQKAGLACVCRETDRRAVLRSVLLFGLWAEFGKRAWPSAGQPAGQR
jgi:hypothetical protein